MADKIEYVLSWRILRVNRSARWPDHTLEEEGSKTFNTLEEALAVVAPKP